jgi:hypothetical protein
VTGWNDVDVFDNYPPRDQVRPLMQRLFDQIKTYLGLVKTEVNAHKADVVTDTDGAHGLKIEEGTWTPVLRGTTGGANTFTQQHGRYFKIGRKVTLFFSIDMSVKDPANAGDVAIYGIPFTTGNATIANYSPSGAVSYANLDLQVSPSQLCVIAGPVRSGLEFRLSVDNGSMQSLPASALQNNTTINGEITYLTN